MTARWETKKLGELAELRGRIGWRGLTAKEYTKEGPLFLSVHSLNYGDYVDFRDAFHISEDRYLESPEIMLQKDDILICKDGAGIGKVGILSHFSERATINSSLLLIRSGKHILPKFLYFCLTSPYFQEIVQSRLNGATTPHLYQRDIAEFPVVLPPLSEQQRIVALLDEAFESIAKTKANTEKNLQNAHALFESYLETIFSQSERGWEKTTLGKATSGVYTGPFGSLLHKSDYISNGIPLVNPAHITDGGIEPDLRKTVSIDTANRLDSYIMRDGDIVIGRRGDMGRCALVTKFEDGWLCGTGSFFIKSSNKSDPRFLVHLLRSERSRVRLLALAGGAVMPNLSNSALSNFRLELPPIGKQRAIARRIDELLTETQHLTSLYKQKLAALESLKKSLLHQAFSGELTRTKPKSKVIPFPAPAAKPITTTDMHAGILALAFRLHEKHGKPTDFNHVKAEKIAHMVEAIVGVDLGRNPIKYAAGPNDFRHLKGVEHRARLAGFFVFKRSKARGPYQVTKLRRFDEIIDRAEKALADQRTKVEHLLETMTEMTWRDAEIFATTYAAWNNLLLDGKRISDEAIVREARENWHPEKLKIPRDKFFSSIEWMRKRHLTPQGQGKKVLPKAG